MHQYRIEKSLRANIGIILLSLALLIIFAGLFYHQIIRHRQYLIQSESNRIRIQPITPKRGVILDRNYQVIADNRLSFTVSMVPFEVKEGVTYRRLSELLGIDSTMIARRARANFVSNYIPTPIKRGLGIEVVSILEERGDEYPGIAYSVESVRQYERSISGEAFIGYVGEVSPDEIKAEPDKQYRPGSLIGKKGIEKTYDHYLRGIEGTEFIEISARGKIVGPYSGKEKISAVAGSDLVLTIDKDLQRMIVNSFDTQYCCGAVAALDPRNGEVLALASFPELDPNIFSGPIPSEVWQAIVGDSDHPLLNRPIAGLYTPGSTAKPLTAGAALEQGKINDKTLLKPCYGSMRFGNRSFRCWYGPGHGRLDLYHAIEQSCNVYFYQVGQLLGLEPWFDYAVKCGFGKKTGVDITGEFDGIAPNSQYMDRLYGEKKWSPLLILNIAIGQGEFTITPLQLAQFYCGLANNGLVYRPHLLREIINPDGASVRVAPSPSFRLPFSSETMRILKESLFLVVQGEDGTARGRRNKDYNISGKTGTAQNPHGDDHSWFVAYAPSEAPLITVVAIIENGGHGSEVAAPLVGKVIDYYLNEKVDDYYHKPPIELEG